MSTILHLSDLHLGRPADHQLLDDHKSTIGKGDQQSTSDLLSATLEALDADGRLEDLTAVVVSGDLTNRAEGDEFSEFRGLIANISKRVGAGNVVVVPGNHDVPKEHGPEDTKRYERFNAVTRNRGMTTPLLDGLDFTAKGHLNSAAGAHPHVVEHDNLVIVPINSSQFCWGLEEITSDDLDKAAAAGLGELIEHLRRHDVARVSNAQMRALERYLGQRGIQPRKARDRRVRIAVLHHQLLPVGTREEMKAFESLTNLGAVRALLRELQIDVVLHGHKHTSTLYWDHVPSGEALSSPAHRMLVVAAPGSFAPGAPVARLLRVGEREDARDILVDTILAPAGAGGKPESEHTRARLWQRPTKEPSDAVVVRGVSVSEVYGRLQSLLEDRPDGEPLRDVLCEVEDPKDAGSVPADYPEPAGVTDVQAWLTELVEWWQKKDSQLLDWATFNHGERIYRRWGDQARHAAETLRSAAVGQKATTRAVIVLYDQAKDTREQRQGVEPSFPSFVLAQLQIARTGGTVRLDCTGYFRKQEMRYWWPINVAELACVQKVVLADLPDEAKVKRGRLRTFTAFAEVEERLPAVAVPAIDRAVDQRPRRLWEMAVGVAHPPRSKSGCKQVRELWEAHLRELDPAGGESGRRPRISYRGLARVSEYLQWLGADSQPVGKATGRLADLYKGLAGGDPSGPQELAPTIEADLTELREALDKALGPVSG
ncbi:MAG TPA: metallophosphoesterase [Solirubrobacteraceae bacterium]|nr:metallophosphoesterase [Solirubrobacteraceae bacterium]